MVQCAEGGVNVFCCVNLNVTCRIWWVSPEMESKSLLAVCLAVVALGVCTRKITGQAGKKMRADR